MHCQNVCKSNGWSSCFPCTLLLHCSLKPMAAIEAMHIITTVHAHIAAYIFNAYAFFFWQSNRSVHLSIFNRKWGNHKCSGTYLFHGGHNSITRHTRFLNVLSPWFSLIRPIKKKNPAWTMCLHGFCILLFYYHFFHFFIPSRLLTPALWFGICGCCYCCCPCAFNLFLIEC